ncbi:MAG: AAA family ATPase [Candidatus Nanopelagicales bacterium]
MGDGVRRWVVTGTPGAGKTTLVDALEARGHAVSVRESATDVMAAYGSGPQPWGSSAGSALDEIVALQRRRELEPLPPGGRSRRARPVAGLHPALARHMGYDVPLARSRARPDRGRAALRAPVPTSRGSGFLTPTDVRRIDEADTLRFDRIHRETYLELGYELVEVPVLLVEERVALVESLIGQARRRPVAPPVKTGERLASARNASSAARTAPGFSYQTKCLAAGDHDDLRSSADRSGRVLRDRHGHRLAPPCTNSVGTGDPARRGVSAGMASRADW